MAEISLFAIHYSKYDQFLFQKSQKRSFQPIVKDLDSVTALPCPSSWPSWGLEEAKGTYMSIELILLVVP